MVCQRLARQLEIPMPRRPTYGSSYIASPMPQGFARSAGPVQACTVPYGPVQACTGLTVSPNGKF